MNKILVIAPHMDDEVLGCGGTIAKHVARGDEVTVCIVCNRAYHRQYNLADIELEKQAAKKAQSILGYQELIFLDQPDERLYIHLQEALNEVEKVTHTLSPNIVYTCFTGDLHQDHRVVAHISNIVLRPHAVQGARRILAYEVPSGTEAVFSGTTISFQPTVFNDIEKQLNQKIEAMQAYQRESRLFPHPRSPELLKARAYTRGVQGGLIAAEAFMLLRETC